MQTEAPGGAETQYQAALKQGRFLIQRCNDRGSDEAGTCS